jgi:transcriptional regulator with XRE-family HTH domain
MSLSDYIKYLRALKGGVTPWEIEEASGVPARVVHLIEVKHRRMGEDDALLEKLAAYFGVPVEELTRRREAYRKRLTYFLEEARRDAVPVAIRLENGEELVGAIQWYSREALALMNPADGEQAGPYVVQRAWVADWRRVDSPYWEVAESLAGGHGSPTQAGTSEAQQ